MQKSTKLSHVGDDNQPRMVDVSHKERSQRCAKAQGWVRMNAEAFAALEKDQGPKGAILDTARLAGVMAAKKVGDMIPLCHPLNLSHADVDMEIIDQALRLRSVVRCAERTGVEMEALTAVSVAALTVIDMLKALDPHMVIDQMQVIEKSGGKHDFSLEKGV